MLCLFSSSVFIYLLKQSVSMYVAQVGSELTVIFLLHPPE